MATPLRNANLLLSDLADPFLMFPIETIADTLFEAVGEVQGRKFRDLGAYGVPRKYWTVEEEHYHQEEGLLLGAVFVLGQAAITQTTAVLNELKRHPEGSASIPTAKDQRMTDHATVDVGSGLSRIVIINAVANYFKHVYEWPENWATTAGQGPQASTISIALQIGMSPQNMADNLWIAARRLGLSGDSPRAIAQLIQGWREAWANALCPPFGRSTPP